MENTVGWFLFFFLTTGLKRALKFTCTWKKILDFLKNLSERILLSPLRTHFAF